MALTNQQDMFYIMMLIERFLCISLYFLLRACSFWVDVVIQIHGNCTEFSEIFEIYVGNEYNILVIHNE